MCWCGEGERRWNGTRFGSGWWSGLGRPGGSTTEMNKVPVYGDNVLRRHFEFISCYTVWSAHAHTDTPHMYTSRTHSHTPPLPPKGNDPAIAQGRSTADATTLKLNWMINHNCQLSKRIKAPARDLCLLLVTTDALWPPSWVPQALHWQCQLHLQNDQLFPQPAAPKGKKGTSGVTNPSCGTALGDGTEGWQWCWLCWKDMSCRTRHQAVPRRRQVPRKHAFTWGGGREEGRTHWHGSPQTGFRVSIARC